MLQMVQLLHYFVQFCIYHHVQLVFCTAHSENL